MNSEINIIEQWLKSNGIDCEIDIDDELFIIARKFTIKFDIKPDFIRPSPYCFTPPIYFADPNFIDKIKQFLSECGKYLSHDCAGCPYLGGPLGNTQ